MNRGIWELLSWGSHDNILLDPPNLSEIINRYRETNAIKIQYHWRRHYKNRTQAAIKIQRFFRHHYYKPNSTGMLKRKEHFNFLRKFESSKTPNRLFEESPFFILNTYKNYIILEYTNNV
jgi:hypothetical protein